MKYIDNLYYGDKASKNKLFTKWCLSYGRHKGTYVLTLPRYNGGILEIRKLSNLRHIYYKKYPLTVVGVALGYRDAVELAARIVRETYEKNGSFDVQGFLLGA